MTIDEASVAIKAAPLLIKGITFLKNTFKNADNKLNYEFREAHVTYCCNIIKKYCRARTFFIRTEPQFLDDFYVPASIIRGHNTRIKKANLSSLRKIAPSCIVTGSGGSGKTIFMRHLLLDAIERGIGYPVFIELRNLNDLENISLEDVIVKFMIDHGFPLSEEYALRSLHEGLLVVLLDGFDEVVFSKRKLLENSIKRMGSTSKSQIIISSRPDMALEGWDGFATTSIAPLDLEEACELIEKIKFDDDYEIKSHFIEKLKSGLFKSHSYFLSNPLLLSIMLLTYGDSADIPKKFASFYEQAYTALFQKHDALKSGYRRERRTDLDVYEFSRLFSAFSAITYNKRAFRFSLVEAVSYVNQSKRVSGARDVSAEGFLDDARQAVCLLIEDGLDLAFVHRSFQEYFVAKFINEADSSIQGSYINNISSYKVKTGFDIDSVLRILYEMNPVLVEDYYLIPGLDKLFGTGSNRKISMTSWKRIFRKTIGNLQRFDKNTESYGFSVKNWTTFSLLIFVTQNCTLKRFKAQSDRDGSADIIFGAEDHILTRDIPDRSPIWKEISLSAGFMSIEAVETIRLEFRSMLSRAEDRTKAVDDVFSFPASD
jgi:hypothetical protein